MYVCTSCMYVMYLGMFVYLTVCMHARTCACIFGEGEVKRILTADTSLEATKVMLREMMKRLEAQEGQPVHREVPDPPEVACYILLHIAPARC
jgi:hypothetical protein